MGSQQKPKGGTRKFESVTNLLFAFVLHYHLIFINYAILGVRCPHLSRSVLLCGKDKVVTLLQPFDTYVRRLGFKCYSRNFR